MSLPTLSVSIANFNHADKVATAVAAVLEQSVQPIEILIWDDASSDNSREVLEEIAARIKVYHGNDDGMLPPEEVDAFKAEMSAAEVDYEFVGYDGAGHGFTNPEADDKAAKFGLALAYNRQADEDSWDRLCSFLDELF